MAVVYVQVRHDELDRTATVPQSAVPHMAAKGWYLAELPEPEPAPQGEPRTVARPATLGRPSEPETADE